jgi:Transaldolase/Fructose-6-phosphate aldolase
MTRPKTKILVDGGDPQETRRVKESLGFVDGQTTNPSLIAKNPHIRELIASGHKLSNKEEMEEYKTIVQTISPLVGDAGVSIEVFSDERTVAQEMFDQGREMFSQCVHQVSMHGRRSPCGTDVGQARHAGQYNSLLFAATGSRGVRSDEGHEATCLRFAFCWASG